MNQYCCAISGESNCKCLNPKGYVLSSTIDVKASFRKLFTDHAVYTVFVLHSLVDKVDASAFVTRLLANQHDIGAQLNLVTGTNMGDELANLLVSHIELAAKVITAAVKRDPELNITITDLFYNSDMVADYLTSLNPAALPNDVTRKMFHTHNQFVIDMTLKRIQKNYQDEQILYDAYYNEILEMSDAISAAL